MSTFISTSTSPAAAKPRCRWKARIVVQTAKKPAEPAEALEEDRDRRRHRRAHDRETGARVLEDAAQPVGAVDVEPAAVGDQQCEHERTTPTPTTIGRLREAQSGSCA